MQPIDRTACQATQAPTSGCPAGLLAGLSDGQVGMMGWQLLSVPGQEMATGHASIAMLVSRALPGTQQRLWLVAPAAAPLDGLAVPTQDPAGQGAPAVEPAYPAGPGVPAAPDARDQVEDWVNEGGAGDDVAT